MPKSTAAIEIEVLPKNGADTKVVSFKQQLLEARKEAEQIVQQFGELSPQSIEAQKKIAGLHDELQKFNNQLKGISANNFQKIGLVASGIAHGFEVGKGALALFGSESKDLEKTLAQVQGAMALSDGIEGLKNASTQFKTLATEVKGNVVKSFSTLKGAFSAIGIGLLVAALGYVIANFEKVKKAVFNLFPGLQKLTSFVSVLIQGFTDWVGITSAQDRALEKLNKSTEKSNEQLDREAKLLEAQGNKLGAFAKQRQKLNNELIQARANLGKNTEKEWGKIIDDTKNSLAILQAEETKYIEEKAAEKKKADEDAAAKRKEQIEKEKANALERKATLLALNQNTLEDVQKATNAAFDTKVKGLKEQGYTEAEILKLRNAEVNKATKEFNDKQKADADKLEADTKANREKFIAAELKEIQDRYQKEINFIKVRDAALTDQTKTNEQIAKLETESLQKQLDVKEKYKDDTIAIETQLADKKRSIREQEIAEEKAKAEKEKEIQQAKYQAVNDSLSAIGEIYTAFASQNEEDQKKAFEVNKAISIAQAIMNTYQGVTSALAAPELFPGQQFINAALALTAGLAAVKKISDTTYQSKSTSSGGIATQQNGQGLQQTYAPRMSSLPSQDILTQNRKVYVTEGDITRTQKRVQNNQSISVVE